MSQEPFNCPKCGEECYYNTKYDTYDCDDCLMSYDAGELEYYQDIMIEIQTENFLSITPIL